MAQVRLHEETVKWMAKFDDLDEIIVKQHLLNFTVGGKFLIFLFFSKLLKIISFVEFLL